MQKNDFKNLIESKFGKEIKCKEDLMELAEAIRRDVNHDINIETLGKILNLKF